MAEDGKDGTDGKGAAGEVQQQLTDLQTKYATAEQEGVTLKEAKEDLERKLEEADKELLSDDYLSFKEGKTKPAAGGGGSSSTEAAGELDLDRASNREIVEFMEKKHDGNLKAATKELAELVKKSNEATQLAFAQVDVQMTAMRHNGQDGKPGFTDNQKAILEIAKKNPSWDAEKCYKQFLLEDKDTKDVEKEKKEKEEAEEDKSLSEKGGAPASVTQDKDLTKDEAADKAYRAAFGSEK